jgi:hypothetical protein
MKVELSGESYLETGSCKQIQSDLSVTLYMSTPLAKGVNYSLSLTIATSLISDVNA